MADEKIPVYRWELTEEELGIRVTVRRLLIYDISTTRAEGTILCRDNIEGRNFEDHWAADSRDGQWVVKCVRDKSGPFDEKLGEPLFTGAININGWIKVFIAKRIVHHLQTGETQNVIPLYTGKVGVCPGDCQCREVGAFGSTSPPRLWRDLMDGYEHPANCFSCSCGRHWFFSAEDERFYFVADDEAWEELTTHDGQSRYWLGFQYDALYLSQTLRKRGLIPLG
ncbi:MAG: hypothetical protein WC227_00890 [Patescibacteria group bacterium]